MKEQDSQDKAKPAEREFMFKYQKPGFKKYTKEIIPESKLEGHHKTILLNELVDHLQSMPSEVQETFLSSIISQIGQSVKKDAVAKTTMPVIKDEPPKSGLIKL